MDLYRHQLADGSLACLLIHVAEGSPTDASAHREFKILKAQGPASYGSRRYPRRRVPPRGFQGHGGQRRRTGLVPKQQLRALRRDHPNTGGQKCRVTIALAPDWSPTGSAGMLQELLFVADWNQHNKVFQDGELVEMTTSTPAEIAGLGNELGTLARPTCWF